MEMIANVDKDFAEAFAQALLPKLEPIIDEKVKSALLIEKPVSLPQLHDLTGYDRETLNEFVAQGMPYIASGVKQQKFLPSEVYKWLKRHQMGEKS